MEDESIDSIKEMIYNKAFTFIENWTSAYADEDSGAKAERMAKEVDLGGIDWFGENF